MPKDPQPAKEPFNYLQMSADIVPNILRAEFGQRWRASAAFYLDALTEGNNQAIKAPWLGNPSGVPPDALGPIGEQRLLERYPAESDEEYTARLTNVWEIWQLAGGPEVILEQLAAAGYPGAAIFTPLEWPSVPPTPYWSQFWVYFPEGTHPVTSAGEPWGTAFQYGDGATWGLQGITAEDLAAIRSIIRKFKPGRWVCRHIHFQISGWFYDEDGVQWGDPGLEWGGESARVNC